MQAPAGGPPRGRAWGRKGDNGSHEAYPPPLQRDGCRASCLWQESNEEKTTSPPPPPTRLRPPKGGGCRKGGADSGPPSRGQSGKKGRQRGEGAGRTTRPCPREASAVQAPAGGAPGERTQSGKDEDGGHAACPTPQQKDKCRATCQCRACDVLTPEEGQRGRPPPPHPQLPHPPRKGARAARGWRGDMGDDGIRKRTPPRGRRGRVGRQRNESAGRTTRPCPKGARAVQAPTGGPPGVQPQEG